MSAGLAMALYNAVLAALGLLLLPVWVAWILLTPRLRRGFAMRCRPLAAASGPTLWVHAASVGEVEAAVPLIRALAERGVELRLTALSDTGLERLRSYFGPLAPRLAPLDLPGLAHVSARRAHVQGLVLMETELWPNTIDAVRRGGGRVLIASGRLSDRSFPRYRSLRAVVRPLLRRIDAVAAQGPTDRERFIELGCEPDRLRVLGDVKLARQAAVEVPPGLREAIGAGPLLLGGSTHPGEEEVLFEAFEQLRARVPSLRLVLVPRHPDRAPELVRWLGERVDSVALRSQGAATARVVVVDTLGELAALYALADLVFAGGTLAPIGGHNLLEPVRAGRVVVLGPHTHNQQAQVATLEATGALVRIASEAELFPTLERLWKDPDRDRAADRAQRLLAERSDGLAATLEWIEELGMLGNGERRV